MSKKLQHNGLWESSRMMLPEHKEAILHHRKELGRIPRPQLDEQALELFTCTLREAAETGSPVRAKIYDAFMNVEIIGYVQQIDIYMKRIKFAHGGQKTWINFADLLHVEPGDITR